MFLRSGEDLTCRNLASLFILNSMQRRMDTFKTEYAIGKQPWATMKAQHIPASEMFVF
jgi:hypothetical protein